MRLVTMRELGGESRAGVVVGEGDRVADLGAVGRAAGLREEDLLGCASVRTYLALDPQVQETVRTSLADYRGEHRLLSELHLGPPVVDPQKIICLGLNYREHALESGMAIPDSPVVFAKYANSLSGPDDEIVLPGASDDVDYEAELAVVVGRRARHVTAAQALDHLAGAMAFNDVSARDLQMSSSQWTLGKAIDTFGPCGPALVTIDEIEDLQALSVTTRLNGELLQDGTTADMIFPVADVVALLSSVMTLVPGDIIATGTPAGVGMGRRPAVSLHPGDTVEVAVEGLGALRNPVVAEPTV